jgi:ribosomal protein S18 acetylase RimI-like enzyme
MYDPEPYGFGDSTESRVNRVPPKRAGPEALDVEVINMSEPMLPRVCEIHLSAFAGRMSARLGPGYVRAFMSWFLQAKDRIALVAMSQGIVNGYVVGAPVGYSGKMNRELAGVAARSMIMRPWLLGDTRIRHTLKARLGFILDWPTSDPDALPRPTMALVGIGVSPTAAGRGIGYSLMQGFESKSRGLAMASMRLSTYPDNAVARRMYENCGWRALSNTESSNRTIYYGRVLG